MVRWTFTVRLFHPLHLAGFAGALAPHVLRVRAIGECSGRPVRGDHENRVRTSQNRAPGARLSEAGCESGDRSPVPIGQEASPCGDALPRGVVLSRLELRGAGQRVDVCALVGSARLRVLLSGRTIIRIHSFQPRQAPAHRSERCNPCRVGALTLGDSVCRDSKHAFFVL